MSKEEAQLPNTVEQFIELNQTTMMEEFFTFLRYPSVSADPQFNTSLNNCAKWLAEGLKKLSFEVQIWPTSGCRPVVFASNLNAGPDKPTLLIYNHYDVQPAENGKQWNSPPFEPQIRQGSVYARGAQDNKGQCFYVLQALQFLQERDGKLPVNIKLCIDGEEEIGSPGLSALLTEKQQDLQADYLAVVDLGIQGPDQPAITLGIRGIVTMDVEVTGSLGDLHSGSQGGIVYNPIHALVELLAGLRDNSGKIAIQGFYDDVVELTPEERSMLSFNFDTESYQNTIGAPPAGGEKHFSPLERAWLRPTLEINGITGGYAGPGFKTVIPAKASAKISCRTVAYQDPEKIGKLIENYLHTHIHPSMQLTVHVHSGKGKAARATPSSRIVQACAKAYSEVYHCPCEYIFEGASIPIVTELAEASGGEIVLLGLGLPTDQIHAPNEHFSVDRLHKGIMIIARMLELLCRA